MNQEECEVFKKESLYDQVVGKNIPWEYLSLP